MISYFELNFVYVRGASISLGLTEADRENNQTGDRPEELSCHHFNCHWASFRNGVSLLCFFKNTHNF